MTATITDLSKYRDDQTPRQQGPARCIACRHEWHAVAPVGVGWLECPGCGLQHGHFVQPAQRDGEHWVCNCGCDTFFIMPVGPYCAQCGDWVRMP